MSFSNASVLLLEILKLYTVNLGVAFEQTSVECAPGCCSADDELTFNSWCINSFDRHFPLRLSVQWLCTARCRCRFSGVLAQQYAAARPCASNCTSPPCRWLNFFLQLQKKAERAAQLHYRCQGLSNEPSESSLGSVLTRQHAAARGAADASRFANTSRGVSIPILFIHNSNSVLCSYAELRTSNLCLW